MRIERGAHRRNPRQPRQDQERERRAAFCGQPGLHIRFRPGIYTEGHRDRQRGVCGRRRRSNGRSLAAKLNVRCLSRHAQTGAREGQEIGYEDSAGALVSQRPRLRRQAIQRRSGECRHRNRRGRDYCAGSGGRSRRRHHHQRHVVRHGKAVRLVDGGPNFRELLQAGGRQADLHQFDAVEKIGREYRIGVEARDVYIVEHRVFMKGQHRRAEDGMRIVPGCAGGIRHGGERSQQVRQFQAEGWNSRCGSGAVVRPHLILGRRALDDAVEIQIHAQPLGQRFARRYQAHLRRRRAARIQLVEQQRLQSPGHVLDYGSAHGFIAKRSRPSASDGPDCCAVALAREGRRTRAGTAGRLCTCTSIRPILMRPGGREAAAAPGSEGPSRAGSADGGGTALGCGSFEFWRILVAGVSECAAGGGGAAAGAAGSSTVAAGGC